VSNENQGRRLDSWKEIADYLGRDVRTAVRWEKEKGLPVRRLPGGKRQSVFAFAEEIDDWLKQLDEPEAVCESPAVAPSDSSLPADKARTSRSFIAPAATWIMAAGLFAALAWLGWSFFKVSKPPSALAPRASTPHEIAFNSPAGTLRFQRTEIDTGIQPYRFSPVDLNGDGRFDLVFSSALGDVVGVLLGKGDGSFQPAQILAGRCAGVESFTLADFNRDGHLDIAAACFAGNEVVVHWGRGDATFPQRTEIPIAGGPRFLAAGDLNEDGWPDLVASSYGDGALHVLMNQAGQLTSKPLSRFEGAAFVALADLNGDKHVDLVASLRIQGRYGLGIFWGKGDSTFRPDRNMPKWSEVSTIPAGNIYINDLNGDGFMDISYSVWNRSVIVILGQGRGEFSEPFALPGTEQSGGLRAFSIGDLDLDGKLDIFVADSRAGSLLLYRGNGDGSFALAIFATVGADTYFYPVIVDINRDGLPDILLNNYFEKRLDLLKADWKKNTDR